MIVVIPCGQKKRPHKCRAVDMYIGPYFNACLRVARQLTTPDKIFILSAKYGFLGLNDTIDTYEQKLGHPGAITETGLRRQLLKINNLKTEQVVVLGGRLYVDMVKRMIPHAKRLFSGSGGMGYQMREMKNYVYNQEAI